MLLQCQFKSGAVIRSLDKCAYWPAILYYSARRVDTHCPNLFYSITRFYSTRLSGGRSLGYKTTQI